MRFPDVMFDVGYRAVSTKVVPSVKAYATLPIGIIMIIGSNSLAILKGP